jgi:hypothetical protein
MRLGAVLVLVLVLVSLVVGLVVQAYTPLQTDDVWNGVESGRGTTSPGVSGVTRIDVSEKSRGRRYRKCYWLAQWPIGGGKAKKRKFSIKRYGERGAFHRALQSRREALKNLPKTV